MKITASILWWLCIVVWIAAIATPGGAAIAAFTRLPALEASMPGIEAYFADDPAGAGRFVAGYVTNPIFLVSDTVSLIAAAGCLLSIPLGGFRPCGPGVWGRVAVLLLAIASVALFYYLWWVAPKLAIELERWREAVLANDRPTAEEAWTAFDPLHRTAARLLNAQMLMLLGAVIAGAIAGVPRHRGEVTNP